MTDSTGIKQLTILTRTKLNIECADGTSLEFTAKTDGLRFFVGDDGLIHTDGDMELNGLYTLSADGKEFREVEARE